MALTRKQIGQRLREVREAIGYTQSQVADRLGMHRPTVSEIEAGRRAVSSEELYRFAELYATPVSVLLADPNPSVEAAVEVLYRRQGPERPETKTAITSFVERCRAERDLEKLLDLPPHSDTRPGYAASVPVDKWEAIHQGNRIAEQERRRLELGTEPVRGVIDLLERQGVRIGAITPLSGDALDGFYLETEELGPCVAVNPHEDDSWSGLRAVFTAAHEYAHWLLRDRQVEVFVFQPGDEDLLEVRANAFAAAFLVPPDGIRAYFDSAGMLRERRITHLSPGDVVRAMDHFGVSRLALLYRLMNLDLIDQQTFETLRTFSVSGAANALGIRFSQRGNIGMRLPMLAILAWRKGLIGAGRAAELCELDIAKFKQLIREIGEEPEESPDSALLGAAAVG
ncbi:MAG: XRE family transcriptional regulator [Chloroflexi bacterium]|nr:XRE family transcriptional regulator [Chloroflexota bacterium]